MLVSGNGGGVRKETWRVRYQAPEIWGIPIGLPIIARQFDTWLALQQQLVEFYSNWQMGELRAVGSWTIPVPEALPIPQRLFQP